MTLVELCNECSGVDHLLQLDMNWLRSEIPHSLGEHPPNSEGEYICNGHCNWKDGCGQFPWICIKCGYIECYGCGEDFIYTLEELLPEYEGHGYDYCRGCGAHNIVSERDH